MTLRISLRKSAPLDAKHTIAVSTPTFKVRREAVKVLDFDIETRRIGFHYGGKGKPDGCEPVVIACAWDNEPARTMSLDTIWSANDCIAMLEWFSGLWQQADIVTGHYVLKFDIPILQGAMMEHGLPPLTKKAVLDTKIHLRNVGGLSQSQENLSALKDLEASKFHMNDNWWRKVARLTQEGLDLAETRVVADVKQHQELRIALAGWFKSPTIWTP